MSAFDTVMVYSIVGIITSVVFIMVLYSPFFKWMTRPIRLQKKKPADSTSKGESNQ